MESWPLWRRRECSEIFNKEVVLLREPLLARVVVVQTRQVDHVVSLVNVVRRLVDVLLRPVEHPRLLFRPPVFLLVVPVLRALS